MLRKFEDDSRVTACQNEISAIPTPAPLSTGASSSLRQGVVNRRWIRRGAAVAVVLGLAACGGGSDDPVAEPVPVPVPSPGPGPGPAPVPPPADPKPAGFTKSTTAPEIFAADGTTDVGDRYVSDTNPARIVVYDATAGKYSELVPLVVPISWVDARTAAQAAGAQAGSADLASPSTDAKMLFIKQAYTSADLPEGGLADGRNGAWIGLQQDPDAVGNGDGWKFLDGTDLLAASTLWNTVTEPNGGGGANVAGGTENFGAIFYGNTPAATDLGMIYDAGDAGAVPPTSTQAKYLIEYATKEAIKP